ncbi:UvrD-helicase domain-containing protein [Escherichia coli]
MLPMIQRSATSNGSLFAPMAAIVSCWRKNSLRTFDDCLVEAVALLRNDSSLGAHFKHIIVDEYQDVKPHTA